MATFDDDLEPDPFQLEAIEAGEDRGDGPAEPGTQIIRTDTDEMELFDDEPGDFGAVVEGDAGLRTPEEAAMRVEEEPPGLGYSEDPGYLG